MSFRIARRESRQDFRDGRPKLLTSFTTAVNATGDNLMKQYLLSLAGFVLAFSPVGCPVDAETIRGTVVDQADNRIEGVMVSAIDAEHRKWTSVFTHRDGSFEISGLRNIHHSLRTRLMGFGDEWIGKVAAGSHDMVIQIRPAAGSELEAQRPANSAFSMLRFDNPRDKMNFKMNCSYCHQVGTIGFRTPEKPVDWETMLRRMDGFGGLYRHTQDTIIGRLMNTYKDDAVDKWPTFVPPPAPTGMATAATITMWEMDEPLQGSFHDLEIGRDGKIYAVNISKHRMIVLDPTTGTQTPVQYPQRTYAPHSIETANDGSLWTTMCASGQMVRFDIETGQFETYSSAEAPKTRGNYPHTLRINPQDPEGLIWYTDAGSNSCFSLHPRTHVVKEYKLLSAGQAIGAGRGESRGITPYGVDYSPVDGMIWYSKLNGNRIGRIDPSADDGDIKEWNPPFRGPRRLHVAPDGMVWVPGFGSGVFGRFDPNTERWTVYELPDAENQIPYALNVDKEGIVWICGTGNDTINRFDPVTETLVEIPLPTRVSYTREIEFDDEGNVWTSTSGPARHMERGVGAVIRISLPRTFPKSGGTQLVARTYDGIHDIGNLATAPKKAKTNNIALFAKLDKSEMPSGYVPKTHQEYVDARMASMSPQGRPRVGQLWKEFIDENPDRNRDGAMFVRILDYVASNHTTPTRRFVRKWQHHNFGSAPDRLAGRSIEKGKLVFEQGTCSRCHAIGGKGAKYGPDLSKITKRFRGSKLLQQIVKPSAEIHKEFQTQMIVVDDGRVLTGLVVKETDDQLRLLPNLLKPDKIETIDKSSIEERRIAEVSTMPIGLLDTYTAEEIFDLLAYIQSASPAIGSKTTR
jgi:putative heme-binding domain-containing protein